MGALPKTSLEPSKSIPIPSLLPKLKPVLQLKARRTRIKFQIQRKTLQHLFSANHHMMLLYVIWVWVMVRIFVRGQDPLCKSWQTVTTSLWIFFICFCRLKKSISFSSIIPAFNAFTIVSRIACSSRRRPFPAEPPKPQLKATGDYI